MILTRMSRWATCALPAAGKPRRKKNIEWYYSLTPTMRTPCARCVNFIRKSFPHPRTDFGHT